MATTLKSEMSHWRQVAVILSVHIGTLGSRERVLDSLRRTAEDCERRGDMASAAPYRQAYDMIDREAA